VTVQERGRGAYGRADFSARPARFEPDPELPGTSEWPHCGGDRPPIAMRDYWLPADMEHATEDDGAVVAWDETYTVRAMTIAVAGGESAFSARQMLTDVNGQLISGADGMLIDVGAEHTEKIDGKAIRTVLARSAVENHQLSLAVHSHGPVAQWAHELISSLRFAAS
jgi:hypothetical protein